MSATASRAASTFSESLLMTRTLLIVCSLLLGGCATRPALYQWGGYDELLYQSYKTPATAQTARTKLEAHIASLEKSQQKVAPGLYAELGTFYLQGGDTAKAVSYYTKERNAWPESRGLMDALIGNLNKPKSADAGSKS